MSEVLKYAFVIHRQMGCADESSTDEEQAEKILYAFPAELSVYNQLTKINMLEGLIEFSSKFSSETIDCTVMANHTWGFLECEKDIWLLFAVENSEYVFESTNKPIYHHNASSHGLHAAMKQLYELYFTFYGRLSDFMSVNNNTGWENLKVIQSLRKQIRKLNMQKRQQLQDIDTLLNRQLEEGDESEHPQLDLSSEGAIHYETNVSVEHHQVSGVVKEESMGIKSSCGNIAEIQAGVDITVRQVISKGNELTRLLADDSFYLPRGLRARLGRSMQFYLSTSGSLLRTVPTAIDGLRGVSQRPSNTGPQGSLIRIRRTVEKVCGPLYRGAVLLHDGSVAWTDLSSGCSRSTVDLIQLLEMQALREKASSLLEFCGSSNSTSKLRISDHSEQQLEGFLAQRLSEVLDGRGGFMAHGWESRLIDLGPNTVVNPLLLWSNSNSQSSQHHQTKPTNPSDIICDNVLYPSKLFCPRLFEKDGGCVGRLVFYRQNRFVLAVLVSAWDTNTRNGPQYLSDSSVRDYLCSSQQPNSSTATEKKNQISVKQFLTALKHDCGSGVISNRAIDDSHIGAVQMLAFCADLQESVTGELAHMEKAVCRSRSVQHSINGTRGTSARSFASGNADASAFESNGTSSGGGVRPTSPIPTTANAAVAGGIVGQSQRDVKVIYHNPMTSAVKIMGFCRGPSSELPTPLAQLGVDVRTMVLDQLRDRDAHRARVVEAVDQRLREELDGGNIMGNFHSRFMYDNAELSSSLEPPVMRALNDLWITMMGGVVQSADVVEGCLRVSTAQRGGVWVMGRRLSGGRSLYVVVDRCATLNDLHEVLEDMCAESESFGD